MEELKRIPGCDDYAIDKHGNVYTFRSDMYRKPWKNARGYYQLSIRDNDNNMRTFNIHTLMGMTWVPKPDSDEKLVMDHIDRNKLNNEYTNLRWVNYSTNVLNSSGTAHKKNYYYYDIYKDGEFIATVKSARKVAEIVGRSETRIYHALEKHKLINGYLVKRHDDDDYKLEYKTHNKYVYNIYLNGELIHSSLLLDEVAKIVHYDKSYIIICANKHHTTKCGYSFDKIDK